MGFVCLGVIPRGAQGFLLALCSGITPGSAQGPCGVLGIKPRMAEYKTNALPAVLSLWPLDAFLDSGWNTKFCSVNVEDKGETKQKVCAYACMLLHTYMHVCTS